MSQTQSAHVVVKPIPIRGDQRVAFTRRSVAAMDGGRAVKFEEIPLQRPTEVASPLRRHQLRTAQQQQFSSPDSSVHGMSASSSTTSSSQRALLSSRNMQQQNSTPESITPLPIEYASPASSGVKCDAAPSSVPANATAVWSAKHLQYTPSPPSQARRRLNLESASSAMKRTANRSESARKAPAAKKPRLKTIYNSVPATPESPSLATPGSSQRQDSSLLFLTQRFINMHERNKNAVVNLNDAASKLNVPKRRLYDITNVLEGIGMIEKVGKNSIRWINDGGSDRGHVERSKQLADANRELVSKESELDSMLAACRNAFSVAQQDPLDAQYAYVTYSNLRSMPTLSTSTLIAIKAPDGSSLQCPDPRDTGRYEMLIRSRDSQPVQVFLCPDADALSDGNTIVKTEPMVPARAVHATCTSPARSTVVADNIQHQQHTTPRQQQQTTPDRQQQVTPLDTYMTNTATPQQPQHAPDVLNTPQKTAIPLDLGADMHSTRLGQGSRPDDYLFSTLGPHEGLADLFSDTDLMPTTSPRKLMNLYSTTPNAEQDSVGAQTTADSESTTARLTSNSLMSI